MKTWLVPVLFLGLATPAFGHRLDEYLQATTILLEKDRISALIRLTPGVDIFPALLKSIDTNSDGLISEAEQQAYALCVLRDLSLVFNGNRLSLRLVSSSFASIDEMKEGVGDIVLVFEADLPSAGTDRRLVLENHHQMGMSAYLANCLVPSNPDIRVTAQRRNYDQSSYQLDYMQAGIPATTPTRASRPGASLWLGTGAVIVFWGFALLWRRPARVDREQT